MPISRKRYNFVKVWKSLTLAMPFRKKKKPNPYKEANEAFLQVKAQEEGIHVLDNGVMYKVLEEGHGTKSPKPNGIVYVHYTGRLIDGTAFDTTEGESLPALFVVRDLIMGWQIVSPPGPLSYLTCNW